MVFEFENFGIKNQENRPQNKVCGKIKQIGGNPGEQPSEQTAVLMYPNIHKSLS